MKNLLIICGLFLLSCSRIAATNPDEGHETQNGGDPLSQLFQQGRDLAQKKVSGLKLCEMDESRSEKIREWIQTNQQRLALDISSAQHLIKESSGATCASTAPGENRDIVLSPSRCKNLSLEQAAELLIHESVHHLAVTDEGFAATIARSIFEAKKLNCTPTEAEVVWSEDFIDQWPVTSQLTNVKIQRREVCVSHTKSHTWPKFTLSNDEVVEGNYWIIALVDGQWRGATMEWLRIGEADCTEIETRRLGDWTKIPIFSGWIPTAGEKIGIMVSTVARFGQRSASQERSNILWIKWPEL